jgi:hypothetical protein
VRGWCRGAAAACAATRLCCGVLLHVLWLCLRTRALWLAVCLHRCSQAGFVDWHATCATAVSAVNQRRACDWTYPLCACACQPRPTIAAQRTRVCHVCTPPQRVCGFQALSGVCASRPRCHPHDDVCARGHPCCMGVPRCVASGWRVTCPGSFPCCLQRSGLRTGAFGTAVKTVSTHTHTHILLCLVFAGGRGAHLGGGGG